MKARNKAKRGETRRSRRAKNGEGGVYRRGRVWYARWTDADGRVHVRSTGEEIEGKARERLAEWVAPFRKGRRVEVLRAIAERVREVADERPPVRVDETALRVVTDPRSASWSAETRRHVAGRVRRWSAWMARERPRRALLRETTVEDAEAFLASLDASGKTANIYRAELAQAWDWLAGPDAGANPWRVARKRPEADSVERRPLSAVELHALLDAAAARGPEWRRLLLVGVYTGLRLGDAARLAWEPGDLAGGWISVRPRQTARTSGARVRVPIAPALAEELARTPAAKRRGACMPALARQIEEKRTGLEHPLQDLWAAAGIEGRERNDRGRAVSVAGFHALRHTFVSMAADAGVPLAVVQAIVGHAGEAMTRRYYHAGDAALRAAAAALPDVREARAPGSARAYTPDPANVAGLERMTDAELRALARAVRALLREREH